MTKVRGVVLRIQEWLVVRLDFFLSWGDGGRWKEVELCEGVRNGGSKMSVRIQEWLVVR